MLSEAHTSPIVLLELIAGVAVDPLRMGWWSRPDDARPPGGHVLLEYVADLRDVARTPQLSGRIERR